MPSRGQPVRPPHGRTAVVTMAMSRDFPHAAIGINGVGSQLGQTTHHFVLHNDFPDSNVASLLPGTPDRTVIEAGEPLGVARGRNILIAKALSWGADRIVVLDDDLIVPSDYIAEVIASHQHLLDQGIAVGAVGPAVLNYGRLRDRVLPTSTIRSVSQMQPIDTGPARSWRKRYLSGREVPGPAGIEHLGINDWQEHYLGVGRRASLRWLHSRGVAAATPAPVTTVVANSTASRDLVCRSDAAPIEVDTVPGGVWCIGASAARELGPLDEDFSPFGFEDAEWCIRGRRSGFRNFALPSLPVLHDFQERLSTRSETAVMETRGRSRGLLIAKHAGDSASTSKALLTALIEPCEAKTPRAAAQFYDALFRSLIAQRDALPAGVKAMGTVTDERVTMERLEVAIDSASSVQVSGSIDRGLTGQLIARGLDLTTLRSISQNVFGKDAATLVDAAIRLAQKVDAREPALDLLARASADLALSLSSDGAVVRFSPAGEG